MTRIILPHHLTAYGWQVSLQTRYGDMDAQAHLNNIAIARLFEEGRVRFNQFLATKVADFWSNRILLAHVRIDYLAEGQYPAPVELGQTITAIGASSFRVGAALFQQQQCIALCESVLVVRPPDGAATLPSALRDRLQQIMDNTDNTGDQL